MRNYALLALSSLAMIAAPIAAAREIGPAIGAQIPEFAARDPAGKPVTLPDIVGQSGTVLVFFRSAKWCPYCQAQLIALKDAAAPLEQRGYKLVAISYDAPEVLASFSKQRSIPYTLLSDKNSAMIDAFKLRDPQYDVGSFAYGVPQPSIFIISPAGIVRAKLAEEGYKSRPPVETVISAVDGLRRQ